MSTQFETDWSLFLAARAGDMLSGREKLDAGANPNFVEPANKRRPSLRPSSVLLRAAGYGHTDFVELLLDSGASIPDKDDERRRLSYAVRCADSPATLLLLFRRGLPPIRDDADWALEKGYSEVQDFANQKLGGYKIIYDIDELLTLDTHSFFSEFSSSVPEYHSVHDHMLHPEERVIRDLWEFSCDTASGFTSLISNEHFDTIVRAHSALSAIEHSLATEAVHELRATMAKYGFPIDPSTTLDHLAKVPDEVGEKFDAEVDALDDKFFSDNGETSLWKNLDYLERGMEFARDNIKKLRTRKQRQ